jgi:hypothetical protein
MIKSPGIMLLGMDGIGLPAPIAVTVAAAAAAAASQNPQSVAAAAGHRRETGLVNCMLGNPLTCRSKAGNFLKSSGASL